MRTAAVWSWVSCLTLGIAALADLRAQPARATLRVQVIADSQAVPGASVRVGGTAGKTDAGGSVVFRLPAGRHIVTVARLGLAPDTIVVVLRASQDTTVLAALQVAAAALDRMVVATTRGARRIEDTPLRVEVIDDEEIAEKVAMTPGDITMMLNETSGLRVQTTSASLGGANVRVHGLRGRYTLLLADGLPLYGGQAGGLGLLQIPPLDLARVEVIKGTASALYGSGALGGVVNLISRRPSSTPVREVLLNQTSRGGSDAVAFLSTALRGTSAWGATLLASAHTQRRKDLDADGWADMPGYDRITVRPSLIHERPSSSMLVTAGLTSENRTGGTLPGRTTPQGSAHVEALETRRADVGIIGQYVIGARDIVSVRASGMEQRHEHQFGPVRENDKHRSIFGEVTIALPRPPFTYVAGAAMLAERYRNGDVAAGAFDYSYRVPSVLAQVDFDAARWLTLTASGRYDSHNVYGETVSPRVSILVRPRAEWSLRLSGGGGTFAPVPFIDEIDAIGLTPVRPGPRLRQERAMYVASDVNGSIETPLGALEVGATVHRSNIKRALALRDAATAIPRVEFVNAPIDARAWGGELLARVVRAPARLTLTYAYLDATEWNPEGVPEQRREVPLSPRHSAGAVASVEREEAFRLGLEVYFTGRQALEHNPFRGTSKPYVIVGLLGERWVATRVGAARLFLNLENIGNVRQTRYDPMLLPFPGQGGRWTTDVWTDLTGFTANAGVRFAFGR